MIEQFGQEFRPVLEWAINSRGDMKYEDLMKDFGEDARYERGVTGPIDGIDGKDDKLFTLLRDLTDGESLSIVDGKCHGFGLKAWQELHLKWDPTTGGRKRRLLETLISPGRARLEELPMAIQRWKFLKKWYENKWDFYGRKHDIPEDIARASLMKLVPEGLAIELRSIGKTLMEFHTFEQMEEEKSVSQLLQEGFEKEQNDYNN